MYQIEIKVQFRYGHRLLAPYKGLCNNPHGEGGTAICFFESTFLDSCGMMMDFKVAKQTIKEWIDANWDHTYLCHRNDQVGEYLKSEGFRVFEFAENPTAENMAKTLFYVIKSEMELPIKKVGMIESFDNSIAWFEE
jgi:6-pyruvoyltetrahydropterin/6-carboxytetrahydropterin synthase